MFVITDSESSNQRLSQLDDSNLEYSNQGSSFSMDTSNQGSVSMDTSVLGNNRTDLSLNENSNQDSVATDQYQEMDSEIKGIINDSTFYPKVLWTDFQRKPFLAGLY